MKVCAESGCPTLTASTRCPKHTKAKRRESDKRRPSARERGYGPEWQRTRHSYLSAFPVCQWPEGCIRPATDVHHLDGKGPKGPQGHDFTNLTGLCHAHHSILTSQQQPGGWAA